MKYLSLSIIIFVGIMITGCRHDNSLFVDPNSPTNATPQTLLTSAEVATMNTYEGDLTRTSQILIQQGVGVNGQATQAQVYSLPQNLFDNQWSQIYQTLETIKLLQTNFGAANPYYNGVADVLMAMNWGILTDMWGDIPYSQALSINGTTNAKYDPQQQVLQGITGLLDSAISLLSNSSSTNAFVPGTDDIIFQGNLQNWLATAYTLKARYLNRYSNKSSYDPATILSCLANGIQNSSQDCMAIHGTNGQESNQWYAYLNARQYIAACATLVDSMKLRPTDIRLYYFYDSTGLGDVIGSPIDTTTDVNVSYWGQYLAGSSATPTPLVTYFEAEFIKAEVEVRTGNANAFSDLNTAIMENCKKVTNGAYSGADIATYTAANTNLHAVMYEKWIAMFGQPEAYNDYRRTKLPNLKPNPLGAINIIPQRYPTPDQESNSNPNAPIPSLLTPVWWAM